MGPSRGSSGAAFIWRLCPGCRRRWLPGPPGGSGAVKFEHPGGYMAVEVCPFCAGRLKTGPEGPKSG